MDSLLGLLSPILLSGGIKFMCVMKDIQIHPELLAAETARIDAERGTA